MKVCASVPFRVACITGNLHNLELAVLILSKYFLVCRFVSDLAGLIVPVFLLLSMGRKCTRAEGTQTYFFNGIIVMGPLEKCRACEIRSGIWFDISNGIPVGS